MKKIYALSQKDFNNKIIELNITDENVNKYNTAFIQIGNTDIESYSFIPFSLKDSDNVLSLRFDDCDEVFDTPIIGGLTYIQQYPMSQKQAEIIYDFIENNKHKYSFLVHCLAGQSRSGGVIKFIAEYFDIPYTTLFRDNPKIYPNQRIVSLLRETREKRLNSL